MMTTRMVSLLTAVAALAFASAPQAQITFEDVTAKSGVTFTHTDGSSGRHYLIETMSAGVALFDYNRDGKVDIYFVNGAPLEGAKTKTPARDALYRNDGNFTFTDVTRDAGVGDTNFGLGVAVGDYNSDGWLDIYVNNAGPNVLYKNNGNGTFTDVTKAAGVAVNGTHTGAGANFLDIDGDGDLDLFVANYVAWSYQTHVGKYYGPWMVYPGPKDYDRTPNVLYRNNGNGTFTDISRESGIAAHVGAGMGTAALDFDNDGDTDIVVANDDWNNFLFQNDGTGKFTETGLAAGIAYDVNGAPLSSMGVAVGDYNNDGWLDVEVTSYESELATLFENAGGALFDDVTRATGAGAGTLTDVKWGNGLCDFDNDGDRDLFVATGHVNDNVEKYSDKTRYASRNLVLRNNGDGKFTNITDQCGDGLAVMKVSRGAAFEDLDNDGDIDAVILNSRDKPTILKNTSRNRNHWVSIHLRGTKNRDGVGAHVRITAGARTQLAEVHSGQGYQSHFGMVPHFGLGASARIDRVEVRWIGGGTDVVENVAADRVITITEGKGETGP
jgi:hypothetical protein